MNISFNIITPERRIVTDDAACVTLPAVGGPLGVLPHHTHMIADLEPGIVRVIKEVGEGEEEVTRYRIAKGVAEVSTEGILTVFADWAERV